MFFFFVFIYAQEDAFEDSIVDFFSLADENRDGIIDYNDFCVVSRVITKLRKQLQSDVDLHPCCCMLDVPY